MKRHPALPFLGLALAAQFFLACGSATSNVTDAGGGTMGSAGKGGSVGTGGVTDSGGNGGLPGMAGTGGTPNTGGAVASGGNGGRGGNPSSGGAGGQAGKGGGGKGGAGGGCVYNGVTHASGTSFPSTDGCNTCSCGPGEQVACTLRACPAPDGGATVCTLDASYRYGQIGGHVAYADQSTLTPPRGYERARTPSGASVPSASCSPDLPACETTNLVDAADVMRDVADPDVQTALAVAEPPLYGYDTRPSDGTVFSFRRSDGHGFLMSDTACPVGTGTCKNTPPGLMRLVTTLRALDQQQLKDDSCKALR